MSDHWSVSISLLDQQFLRIRSVRKLEGYRASGSSILSKLARTRQRLGHPSIEKNKEQMAFDTFEFICSVDRVGGREYFLNRTNLLIVTKDANSKK